MKKLFIALFFLVSISTIFKPEHAFSSIDNESSPSNPHNICLDELFDFYAWTVDEKNLELELPLPQGVQFSDTYNSTKWKNALDCEIKLILINGHHIVSSEGMAIEEAVVFVKVKNTNDVVRYKIDLLTSWTCVDEDGNRTLYTERSVYKGQLACPQVDINKGLEVYRYTNADSGVISFQLVDLEEPILL
jgi:hypothetical protein